MVEQKSEKPDPFQFMLEKRKVIIGALEESVSLPRAWDLLGDKLPEIKEITKFNTFKGYARILNVMDSLIEKEQLAKKEKQALEAELDKVRQEIELLGHELGKVREEKKILAMELGQVREELSKESRQMPNFLPDNEKQSTDLSVPKKVDGWGVQLKGNYYRLFKKIDGKVKWIHVGRKWNIELARKKIMNFVV